MRIVISSTTSHQPGFAKLRKRSVDLPARLRALGPSTRSYSHVRRLLGRVLASAALSYASWPVVAAPGAIDYAAMMRSTADGLIASQSAEGLFPYGFDFLSDRPTESDQMSASNLIRQAGTVSVLAAYYRYTHGSRLQDPLQRSLVALGRRSLPIGKAPLQHWVERAHVLSLPFARWKLLSALRRFGLLYQTAGDGKVVSPDGDYSGALAGTVALSLLAELRYSDAAGDNQFAEMRTAWLNGLLGLRIPGAGFRQMPTSIDESDYFNGEGWLALAVYSDLHREDTRVSAEIADLDQVLMKRYSQKPSPNFFHWGAMAAAQRFSTTGDLRFLEFMRKQSDIFFARLQMRQRPDANHCAAMEGIAATLAALNRSGEGDTARALRARSWLSQEAARLPQLQIQPGQTGMRMGGEANLHAPSMARFAGAFLLGAYEASTRVDAAQHCLSAMIMIDRDHLDHR